MLRVRDSSILMFNASIKQYMQGLSAIAIFTTFLEDVHIEFTSDRTTL